MLFWLGLTCFLLLCFDIFVSDVLFLLFILFYFNEPHFLNGRAQLLKMALCLIRSPIILCSHLHAKGVGLMYQETVFWETEIASVM